MSNASSTNRRSGPGKPDVGDRKAYPVGGAIGSPAAAAFMIRDPGVPGRNITVFEALSRFGGSLDGGGNPRNGYTLRGGRMPTIENGECIWKFFNTSPGDPADPGPRQVAQGWSLTR